MTKYALTSYSCVLAINEVRQPFDTSIWSHCLQGATLLAGLCGYMAASSSEWNATPCKAWILVYGVFFACSLIRHAFFKFCNAAEHVGNGTPLYVSWLLARSGRKQPAALNGQHKPTTWSFHIACMSNLYVVKLAATCNLRIFHTYLILSYLICLWKRGTCINWKA